MASIMKSEILLESGTNEMEIMEFTVAGNVFGINVAKVREIMMPDNVKSMPHANPAVEGVFKPRDMVITVIDLPKYLGLDNASENNDKTLFIVTNFNKLHVAFRVHTVVGIDRVSWDAIEKPDKTIYGGDEGIATGIAQYENRLITILDFEKILADISPASGIQVEDVNKMGVRKSNNHPIVIAEDSVLLAKIIVECLHKAGYSNIIKFDNGQEAWEYLSGIGDNENLSNKVSLIITDIEMPKMDGHRLTKLVKSDNRLKNIPLIIFSSLINDEMYRKGKQLGANEQLSKPDIGHLVEIIDKLIEK